MDIQGSKNFDKSVLQPFLDNFENVIETLTIETDEIWKSWNEEQQIFLEESAKRFKKDVEKFQQCWISELVLDMRKKHISFFSNRVCAPDVKPCEKVFTSISSKLSSENLIMEVLLDTSDYKPEELDVSVCSGIIYVQGKHEEKSEEGKLQVLREFTRKYNLPLNARAEDVESSLSREGLLTIIVR